MNNVIDLNKYKVFVEAITAGPANDLTSFMNACDRLDANYELFEGEPEMRHGPDVNVPLVLNSAMGMSGEAGEFSEIVKKVVFHGKLYSDEVRTHLIKELGDVIWYWTNACRALGVDPNEVIQRNVTKLEARYPGGTFEAYASENREHGDI